MKMYDCLLKYYGHIHSSRQRIEHSPLRTLPRKTGVPINTTNSTVGNVGLLADEQHDPLGHGGRVHRHC